MADLAPAVTLRPKDVRLCRERLERACAKLRRFIDPRPILEALGDDRVLAAAVAAAPPSPDYDRVREMLSGGLAGLRAYVHLGTEASVLRLAGLDPWDREGKLEKRVAALADDLKGEERVLGRQRAIFESDDGRDLWRRAHCAAIEAEVGLLGEIFRGMGAEVGPGSILCFDPASTPEAVAANIALLEALSGRAPQGAPEDRARVAALYGELLRALEGPAPSGGERR